MDESLNESFYDATRWPFLRKTMDTGYKRKVALQCEHAHDLQGAFVFGMLSCNTDRHEDPHDLPPRYYQLLQEVAF